VSEAIWTFICATEQLLPGESKCAFDEVTGAGIAVFNLDGTLYALENRCSHEDFELSPDGSFNTAEASIECPLHGARFDVRSGAALCAPAYESVAKFPVKVEHGGIWSRDNRD
jgi:3-phenylpropionate/trans-cinnamate dioxygenase ferredoxin subunit